jgi:transposase
MNAIGMDVHKSFCQIALLDPETGVLQDRKIDSTPEALRQLFTEQEGQVALEATAHWAWIVDALEALGLSVVLSHPQKTKAIGSAKLKNDKVDARMLARLLAADLLPPAHIPVPAVREARGYLRYRYALVTLRTQVKNRVHGVLAGYGLVCPSQDLFCQKGWQWLKGQVLRPLQAQQVTGYLELIEALSTLILPVESQLPSLAEQYPDAKLLQSLPGIGLLSAVLIVLEIDGIERFPSAKHLVSYAGRCPLPRSRGGKTRQGRITRCGSRYWRWILTEAAQHAAYPRSPLHRVYQQIALRKGAGTAKIAIARKLLESIYQMLQRQQPFDPAAWQSPTG